MTYIGVSPSNGVRRVHTYTASGSQTTFTGASSEGITLSYTDANFMDVYQNGVLLAPADYTATSGTSIVLGEGAAASDIVTITVYDAFSVADTVSKSAGGTFDGNVAMAGTLGVTGVVTANAGVKVDNITIDGTEIDLSSGDLTLDVANDIILDVDHVIRFHKNSTAHGNIQLNSSDLTLASQITDADIKFVGASGGSSVLALTLDMSANGDATFNGQVIVPQYVTHAGDGNTYIAFDTDIIDLYTGGSLGLRVSNGTVTVNENGIDKDFRVEGNNDTHALFVQAGSDHVGINNSSPNSSFTGADNLVIGAGSGHTGMTILSGTSSRSSIEFSDGTGSDATKTAGGIRYYHDSNYMRFNTNGGTERMRINASGNVGLGTTSPEGRLTLGVNTTSSDGLYINNAASGGGELDLVSLGTSYNAHGAGAGEVWLYSPDNINIGGATGGSNVVKILGGGAERMRIESTGRVAIGRSSSYQSAKVTIENAAHGNYLYMGGSTEQNRGLLFTSSVGSSGAAYLGAKHTVLAQSGGGEMQFKNDSYTWFSLLPGGEICVNGTTTGGDMMKINNSGTSGQWCLNLNNSSGSNRILISAQSGTGTVYHHQMNNSNGLVGLISTNGSTTTYATSSDYRIKENVSYNFDATTRLKQLKPARFNFIPDETNTLVDGFIAHEVSSIVPEAVVGEKDAVNEDGSIMPQSIDQSKLVPLLVKTIQELEARLTALEGE